MNKIKSKCSDGFGDFKKCVAVSDRRPRPGPPTDLGQRCQAPGGSPPRESRTLSSCIRDKKGQKIIFCNLVNSLPNSSHLFRPHLNQFNFLCAICLCISKMWAVGHVTEFIFKCTRHVVYSKYIYIYTYIYILT